MTTAFAAGCAMLIASSTLAAPIVNIGISTAGGSAGAQVIPTINQNTVLSPTPGIFEANGAQNDPSAFNEWSISWGVTADDDPSPVGQIGTRLGANFTIVNNRVDGALASQNHLQFSILVNLNLLAGFAPNVAYAANGGPTITVPAQQLHDGIVTTVGNNPMTNFLLNNASQASLFPAGSQLAASSNPGGGSSTNSWSGNVPLTPFAPPPGSMSILMTFDLTPGETVTFNYNYFVIPAPGALALLGLAGVVGGRRRRN
jgi:hypothetical protein